MENRSATVRPATPGDAAALAELVNIAGEGLPLYLWTKMAERGEDPWAVGRRRAQRKEGGFSYRNATLLESSGEVVGGLIGYPLPDRPEPIDYENMPAMFVPLQELENLAPGTWYVNVLAVYPKHRGKGHGTHLLSVAEESAGRSACRGLSIIVADTNRGARRLYERCGYVETASRVALKETWENPAESWVLLVKRFT
jgi:ribosomal protein S18 acetylase RimI-like enzyme